jgi:FkbM family methyltransferase
MNQPSHRYFGQNGEDFLLWRLFGDQPAGFYIDVGAFDGVLYSNSYSFELCGWEGICIEAHPLYFEQLKRARPRACCVHAACVASPSLTQATFHIEQLGLYSGTSDAHRVKVAKGYAYIGLNFKDFEVIQVPARTLDDILAQHLPTNTPVDLISIDVEGSELEVLQGLNLEHYQPRVLVVEANTPENRRMQIEFLAKSGYQPARRVGMNYFYAREKRDLRILKKTTVHCRLEKQVHPLGREFTVPATFNGNIVHHPPVNEFLVLVRRLRHKLGVILGRRK